MGIVNHASLGLLWAAMAFLRPAEWVCHVERKDTKMNIACFSSTPGLCPWFFFFDTLTFVSFPLSLPFIVKNCTRKKQKKDRKKPNTHHPVVTRKVFVLAWLKEEGWDTYALLFSWEATQVYLSPFASSSSSSSRNPGHHAPPFLCVETVIWLILELALEFKVLLENTFYGNWQEHMIASNP
jgi:hypothetical protein